MADVDAIFPPPYAPSAGSFAGKGRVVVVAATLLTHGDYGDFSLAGVGKFFDGKELVDARRVDVEFPGTEIKSGLAVAKLSGTIDEVVQQFHDALVVACKTQDSAVEGWRRDGFPDDRIARAAPSITLPVGGLAMTLFITPEKREGEDAG